MTIVGRLPGGELLVRETVSPLAVYSTAAKPTVLFRDLKQAVSAIINLSGDSGREPTEDSLTGRTLTFAIRESGAGTPSITVLSSGTGPIPPETIGPVLETVPGVVPGDAISVGYPVLDPGLVVANAFVSAPGVVTVLMYNGNLAGSAPVALTPGQPIDVSISLAAGSGGPLPEIPDGTDISSENFTFLASGL